MYDDMLFTMVDPVDFEYEKVFVSTDYENSLIYQVNSRTFYLYSLELRALNYDWPKNAYIGESGFLYSHTNYRIYPCKSMLDAMCFLSYANNGCHPELKSRRFSDVTDFLMKNTNLPEQVSQALYDALFEQVVFENFDNT